MGVVRQSQVYLLDSGSGAVCKVNSSLLLEGIARPAEYHVEVSKAIAPRADAKAVASRTLREKVGVTVGGVACATRPFDVSLYAYASGLNTYHMRCCRTKSKDIVGRKWSIAGEGAGKKDVEQFFKNAFRKMTFGEGMGQVWTDYEAVGNGYLELVPTAKGEQPAELVHIPATEMWVRLDGLGFVQQRGGESAHFRDWFVPDEAYDDLADSDPLRAAGVTTVMHFADYFSFSPYYGIPCIMPAWNRVALMVLESEFNLQFFANGAIPDYAVILEGEWGDDAVKKIQDYFRLHLKGQAHKTLAMDVAEGKKIHFEKLTSDAAKEGAFRLLRQDCRDEILQAHGVPPQKVGIVEASKMGGNKGDDQIKEYKLSIVDPGREKVTSRMNALIEWGWKTDKLTLEFEQYSIDDAEQQQRIDCAYLDRNVVRRNEVRKKRYPELPPLPDGDEPLAQGGDATAALEDFQRELRRAMGR